MKCSLAIPLPIFAEKLSLKLHFTASPCPEVQAVEVTGCEFSPLLCDVFKTGHGDGQIFCQH
jgi:hypothetical protein